MPESKTSRAEYLVEVERLLHDLADDDLQSLMSDLLEQLADLSDEDVVEVLGTPEDFAGEYRRSAGLSERTSPDLDRSTRSMANTGALVLLPLVLMMMVSMGGGMFFFGPGLIGIGWLICRRVAAWIRAIWAMAAGVLVGWTVYLGLAVAMGAPASAGIWASILPVWAGVAATITTAVFFWRTTGGVVSSEGPGHLAKAAMVIGGLGILNISMLMLSAPRGEGLRALAAAVAILVIVGAIVWSSMGRKSEIADV